MIGAGLMGGSVGMALRAQRWTVYGSDRDEVAARRGVERGAFDAVGLSESAALTFVCTPVVVAPSLALEALRHGGVVTDIGGVKAPIVKAVGHP